MIMIDFSIIPSIVQSIAILAAVVIVKFIIGRFSSGFNSYISSDNSMKYFNYYCQRLSDKVNKPNNSKDQQKIAGFIALLITLVPVVIILWLFEEFIAINWLWQFLLLYFAFGNFNLSNISTQISDSLLKDDKQSAKNLLNSHCLRDVSTLSTMGLSKATIEMQLLKNLQLHFTVACCFLLIGPIMALAYRLILEMHYSWNIKLTNFHYFGTASNFIQQIILWLPTRIYYLIYLATTIDGDFLSNWRLTRQYFFQLNTNIIIALHAFNQHIKLGGVAMYKQKKIRRDNFNDTGKAPEIADIGYAHKRLLSVNIAVVMCIFTIALISYFPLLLNR